ncbi:selenium-dependent xanthine dehydrogenase [Anaerococcus porci]|uniref:selenium-dependent xanthine dehydrogenase n=1 Tax=Anaerococcus porci TaxID=2652269 RepID=UPI002A749985|nr:selenium-dependent xanthine dehydrogenase [Anaerococcus porci]MDY3005712.1 selenium-dependent xanthine dehydrogenase [Anaerococcus porci]
MTKTIRIGEKNDSKALFVRVNGKVYETYEDKTLLRFLRDDLKLTSVKDGCSQGACGTCTVLVGDASKKACVVRLSKLNDQEVITSEGLKDEEKEAFTYAFTKAGAVQCGFCIPGMVMSGVSVIRSNPNPTEDDIRKGIRGNICRCTGYKKIVEGIMLASAILRGDEKINDEESEAFVGARADRIDARDKILGTGIYADDIELDNMLYGSCVRTKYPRAKLLKLDPSKALELDGVVGVLTAKDVPVNLIGHIQRDWPVFIDVGEETKSLADAFCFVVAEDEKTLEKAKKLVEVELEELKPVSTIEEAMAEDAPKIHPDGNLCQKRHVSRGDAKKALENSKYIASFTYKTPLGEHAYLEPECCVAEPYKDGVRVYSSDQSVYDTRRELSIMFNWEDTPERIVVVNPFVGGAFGGKEDMSVQPPAALAAYLYQRPVKHKFTRDESLRWHPKRHPMEGKFTIGCDENGIFQGMECEIYFDTGAYASLCGPVLERACTHSVGPYNYQNTDIKGFGYYTNNPPSGAFRGFGVCQSNFAMESNINILAEKVGISPWEIRYRNAIKPGEVLPNGQIADRSTALVECLEAVKDIYEENKDHAGIAVAMKNAGVGVGLKDIGRVKIVVDGDMVKVYSGATCIGQGVGTIILQMIGKATSLPYHKIKIMPPNTLTSPDSGTTSGSRHTLITGEAAKKCAEKLAKDLENHSLEELDKKEYFYEYDDPTDPLGSDKPNPKSHLAYGFAAHVVVLDDNGKVTDVYAAHDSGKVVNPTTIEGQIEGGVVMSLGYALTEDLKLKDSVIKAKYGNMGLWRSTDTPRIHPILIEKEELLDLAYGAKGIGEIATIPTAPAVQGAYYALDGDLRLELPLRDTFYKKTKKIEK